MGEWQPASIEYVKQLIDRDLPECDGEQLALFKRR
jgi:hypothetical protein